MRWMKTGIILFVCILLLAVAVVIGQESQGGSSGVSSGRGNQDGRTDGNKGDSKKDSPEYGAGAYGAEIINTVAGGSSGTSSFDSLVYDDEEMAEMKLKADQRFRDMFGYEFTAEGLHDSICSDKIPATSDSYAYIENPNGRIQIVAHVEGEKQPYTAINETNTTTGELEEIGKYLYKLYFSVANNDPENKTLTFTVYVDSTKLYNKTTLQPGKSISKSEFQQSDEDYSKICIKFTGSLPNTGALSDLKSMDEVCNKIVLAESTPSTYNAPSYVEDKVSQNTGSGSSGSSGNPSSANQI
jgi:hypothetical protein